MSDSNDQYHAGQRSGTDVHPHHRQPGAAQFVSAETQPSLTDDTKQHLAQQLERLAQQRSRWSHTDCRQRIELIQRTMESVCNEAAAWVESACRAKRIAYDSPAAGEEWLAGPCIVMRNLRLLRDSLRSIEHSGRPRLTGTASTLPSGQVRAPVFPIGLYERLLFPGLSAEVWMQPDLDIAELESSMAVAYHDASRPVQLGLVLGAGNVSSIGPTDAFYKLFVDNQVVVLKMNPVNTYLTEHFARALQPLIEFGVLQIVTGDAEVGQFLCTHSLVETLHLTGSDKTHDAIVFGPGAEGERRKQQQSPQNRRPITSELGNVSPVIIVPGRWSDADLAFQAENVASMLANNAGFNCNAARVVVLHRKWQQRTAFLDAVKAAFQRIAPRYAYYPGAAERYADFTTGAKTTEVGQPSVGSLPWAIVEVSPEDVENRCFTTEAFCSVMAMTSIDAGSVAEYIDQAVEFANERVWGTLSVSIICKPATCRDENVRAAMDRAVAKMRFGTVAVNHWTAVGYALVAPTWGAFPGHPTHDIRSGRGVVHNTYMFDRPQKSVIRGPFRMWPKPVWFATHRRTHRVGPALLRYEAQPTWNRVPPVVAGALDF